MDEGIRCPKCDGVQSIDCPCNVCDVVTPVPFCPYCEPSMVRQFEKGHGINVCDAYARRQLEG